MLKRLRIRNFRCFEDHVVDFRSTALVVGQNNAGKSTLLEALKLIATVTLRYRHLPYKKPPNWTSLKKDRVGVQPVLDGFDLADPSVFHAYREPPAIIEALFRGNHRVTIHLGENGQCHAVLESSGRTLVTSLKDARRTRVPVVAFLPSAGPLRVHEARLTYEYVRKEMNGPLAPSHFRNQLFYFEEYFSTFKLLSEELWPRIAVNQVECDPADPNSELSMAIRDQDFVAEVGHMGHGLQVWLQIMWFLARAGRARTIVLDEPDVYLHPDLQRKLIRALRSRHRQVIVASHSVEVMAEVSPSEILVVNRRRARSDYADSLSVVQRVIDNLGGVHNVHLARLATARSMLIVEGDDADILREVQTVLCQPPRNLIGAIPEVSVGGWGGWRMAVGAAAAMRNVVGEKIHVYCVFDRDYFPNEVLEDREKRALETDINVHVWRRKEVENYLLVPAAVVRCIQRGNRKAVVSCEQVEAEIERVCEGLKNETLDCLAQEYHAVNKKESLQSANSYARKRIDEAWKSREAKWALVSGKQVLSGLSKWSHDQFKVNLSPSSVARAMAQADIHEELAALVRAIDSVHPLPPGMKTGF